MATNPQAIALGSIPIKGQLINTVDCSCYEIAAVPILLSNLDCNCDQQSNNAPGNVTPPVKVNADGSFEIDVTGAQLPKWFPPGTVPRFYFLIYQDCSLKFSTRETYIWDPNQKNFNLWNDLRPANNADVDLKGYIKSNEGNTFNPRFSASKWNQTQLTIDLCAKKRRPWRSKVCGKITNCRNKPLAGVKVRVVDIDLYGDASFSGNPAYGMFVARNGKRSKRTGNVLGSAVTNSCGEYCVCYTLPQYIAYDIETADIRVVASFKGIQLAVSNIVFNAGKNCTVDLKISGGKVDEASEFWDYDRALTKLGCTLPADRAALDDEQLQFISHEANIPIEHISLLRQAYQLDALYFHAFGTSLGDIFFPEVIYGLLRMNIKGPFTDWARRYHGPAWNIGYGDAFAQLLKDAIANCIIERNLGLPLTTINIKKVGILIWFISLFYGLYSPVLTGRSSRIAILKLIASTVGGLINVLLLCIVWLEFGINDNFWKLVNTLAGAANEKKVRVFFQLVEISGYYAPALKLILANPTTFINSIGSDTNWGLYFTTTTVSPPPTDIAFSDYSHDVLQRARLQFGSYALLNWASGPAGSFNFGGLVLTPTQTQQSAQRLSRLTTSVDFAILLASVEFTSAYSIAALNWGDFLVRLGGVSVQAQYATQALYTYTKARETTAVTAAITLQLAPSLNAPLSDVSPGYITAPDLSVTSLASYTGDLFGSGSSCACEGRMSVFSPAAYLYALRHFASNITGAIGAIDNRRPEMRFLRVSHSNSYTTLPTIDLNNEVLEQLIATWAGVPPLLLTDRQCLKLDANELAITTEFTNDNVYDLFADETLTRWPWTFPFDLSHAKRRLYLDAISLSRVQINELTHFVSKEDDLSRDALDINEGQRTCITSAGIWPATNIYGVANTALQAVPTMMSRSQLSFQELYLITQLPNIFSSAGQPAILRLSATTTILGGIDGTVPNATDPSIYSLCQSSTSVAPPTDDQLDRIHRFVRIWRTLSWPMQIIDWAIGQFTPTATDGIFPLKELGEAELIRKRLNLEPHEVVGFWFPLDTTRLELPFIKNKIIPSVRELIFKLQEIEPLSLATAAKLAGVSEQLAIALIGLPSNVNDIPIAMASKLFRHGRLARAIPGLMPEDIKNYEDLLQVDVFATPMDTWNALNDFEILQRSGTTLSEVIALYYQQADARIPSRQRDSLLAMEDLNRKSSYVLDSFVSLTMPFDVALSRFITEATARKISDILSKYSTGSDPVKSNTAIIDLIALPNLSLSIIPGDDLGRKTQILTALSDQRWHKNIWNILSASLGIDAAIAQLISDNVNYFTGTSLTAKFRNVCGDGGDGWSTLPPDRLPRFLDQGIIHVDAADSPVKITGHYVLSTPGSYDIRITANFSTAATVTVDDLAGSGPQVMQAGVMQTFLASEIEESDDLEQPFQIVLTTTAACDFRIELVEPSGDVVPMYGTRLYAAPATGLDVPQGALDAQEVLQLSSDLITQWELQPDDMSALFTLQNGNAGFPSFPPIRLARPIVGPLTPPGDKQGFADCLDYARLIAAIKLTSGEGRKILYETARKSQQLVAPVPTSDDSIWAGLALALKIDQVSIESASTFFMVSEMDIAQPIPATPPPVPSIGVKWLKLFDLSLKLNELQISADTLVSWDSSPIPIPTALNPDLVDALQSATREKLLSGRAGLEKFRAVVDNIRILKRDVSSDYILANASAHGFPWTQRLDISDYVLSDIEQEPCADVSRVRFEIAGVQRLITQILGQKEVPPLTAFPLFLNNDQEIEWSTICLYRLWEVRQKILLWPENWMTHGQHLHRSPEFEELKQNLVQGDLTEEIATEVLTGFAEGVHALGHLEIVGTCPQQEYDATGALSVDLLHVIGRTPAEPRAYYNRSRVDGAYWTPWVKMELEIDGEQIVPLISNRQLHVLWLVADSVAQEKPDVKRDNRQIGVDDSYLNIRLAWSVLTTKGWRGKMISKDSLPTRFGHFAQNSSYDLNEGKTYVELQGWNQASQNIGDYQIRPHITDEGDPMIELFSVLETTAITKANVEIADWVYQERKSMGDDGDTWFQGVSSNLSSSMSSSLSDLQTLSMIPLYFASPAVPTSTSDDTQTQYTKDLLLFGRFTLTPDNQVQVTHRTSALSFASQGDILDPTEMTKTSTPFASAIPKNGAYEFDIEVELFTSGAYQPVLEEAGPNSRVVVTRQEDVPSKSDPVFCRIQNKSFFAFKLADPTPAIFLNVQRYDPFMLNPFRTAAREYIDRATVLPLAAREEMLPKPSGAKLFASKSLSDRVGYPSEMVTNFSRLNLGIEPGSSGNGWRFLLAHQSLSIEMLRATKAGLDTLYNIDTQKDPRAATSSHTIPFIFDTDFVPVVPWVDRGTNLGGGLYSHLPIDELEFAPDRLTSLANWEHLYHAPMVVAVQKMKLRRFDEARQWIARVFNPRNNLGLIDPANYWVFKPFWDFVEGDGVSDFQNLDPSNPSADPYLKNVFRALVKQWRENPYNPHAVAAFRPQAYQLAALFLQVENLIAWGDYLMPIPSAELVEEAARRYEEAYHIIGRAPQSTGGIRVDATAPALQDVEAGLALGSVDLENYLDISEGPSAHVEDIFIPDLGLGYFCLPPNPKIQELRRKIQDRLFKVHHCLDLLGKKRKLPLYDPPIDPALLADAAMAGVNVSQAVMDAYAPRPNYRSRTLIALAKSISQQASALGNGLLSALEKKDVESLSYLKMTHESKVLERATAVRKLQVEDAVKAVSALEATMNSVDFRRQYYDSREFMNAEEILQIELSVASTIARIVGQALGAGASAAGAIPDITVGVAGFAASPVTIVMTGGANASRVPAGLSTAISSVGEMLGTLSSIAGSVGSFQRRKDDWEFQAESAKLEGKQINEQILAAKIRQSIAEKELSNHEAQLEQSRDELDFIRTKQTAIRLYDWLSADIGNSYYSAFQLAQNVALQAQRAMQDELGTTERFISYSQWDSSKNGLQAGERLMNELLEMESTFYSENSRLIPKMINVSLAQVDPTALALLKLQGTCTFNLRESFWDKQAPGLYYRRYSSVAVSVPNITGAFGGVHGRVFIESASYRAVPTLVTDPSDPIGYDSKEPDDSRIVTQFPRPGDVITLSTGVKDTGQGNDEIKEDRYRPWEYLGVDSTITCEISQRDNNFDLSTIGDVILHVEYLAREGGEELRNAARASLKLRSPSEGAWFSIRHQFASIWQMFKTGLGVQLDILPLLPIGEMNRNGRKLSGASVMLLFKVKTAVGMSDVVDFTLTPPATLTAISNTVSFTKNDDGGFRYLWFNSSILPSTPTVDFKMLGSTPWSIQCTDLHGLDLEDAIIAINWEIGS